MLRNPSVAKVAAAFAVAALALGACSSSSKSSSPPASAATTMPSSSADMTNSKTIVDIAAGDANFSTLVTAVKAAGLGPTLAGAGPFTVFAPTNAAFAKLPAGTVQSLLEPRNKQKLTDILTYHVIPAKVMAADVKPGPVKTVNGEEITISTADGKVLITDAHGNKATVVKTDIVGSNGVIHVIDSVLQP